MGQVLLQTPATQRLERQNQLLEMLRDFDWSKGDHWLGIAGNHTSTGVFSVKGTKEVTYAVFNAFTDLSDGGYARIRHLKVVPSTHAYQLDELELPSFSS